MFTVSILRSAFHFLVRRETVVRREPELGFYRVGGVESPERREVRLG